MKILIAEDDIVSRKYLQKFLSAYGDCDMTVDGIETVDAYLLSLNDGNPYKLICLDIMMPKLDGLRALKIIRDIENEKKIPQENRTKIIMTTALNEQSTITQCFKLGCDNYISKPIDTDKLLDAMKSLKIMD